MALYQVYLHGGVTAGLEVSEEGIVTRAAPVLAKSVGRPITQVREWVKRLRGDIVLVQPKQDRPKKPWKPTASPPLEVQ